MTLGEKQRLFTECVGKLIAWAYAHGYELTFGDAYRAPAQAAANAAAGTGISNSLHCKRLAVDFNLFEAGIYRTDTASHKPLGTYWKTLHPLCRWGGDFSKPDGNHYSIEHEGVK
jgi:hypothetical protein